MTPTPPRDRREQLLAASLKSRTPQTEPPVPHPARPQAAAMTNTARAAHYHQPGGGPARVTLTAAQSRRLAKHTRRARG